MLEIKNRCCLNNRRNCLREFGVQTICYLCPCVRGVGLLSAVLLSGQPVVHFAQTLRFSRFIACPPPAV